MNLCLILYSQVANHSDYKRTAKAKSTSVPFWVPWCLLQRHWKEALLLNEVEFSNGMPKPWLNLEGVGHRRGLISIVLILLR